jgi:hypothetical protein
LIASLSIASQVVARPSSSRPIRQQKCRHWAAILRVQTRPCHQPYSSKALKQNDKPTALQALAAAQHAIAKAASRLYTAAWLTQPVAAPTEVGNRQPEPLAEPSRAASDAPAIPAATRRKVIAMPVLIAEYFELIGERFKCLPCSWTSK